MNRFCLLALISSLLLLHCISASAQTGRGLYIAQGDNFLVAVQSDGTVKAVGDNAQGQCDTGAWRDVVAVSAGFNHTLGLKKDGTVYAAGDNSHSQCNVQGWKDMAMVSSSFYCSYGLTREGKILTTISEATAYTKEMEGWRDITWIGSTIVGNLCAVDAGGQPHVAGKNVSGLRDVAALYDTDKNIYALKKDGTVRFTSYIGDEYGIYAENPVWEEMDRIGWTGLVAIDCDSSGIMALKQDGTVIGHSYNKMETESWSKISKIEGGFGVLADGSMIFDMTVCEDYSWEQLNQVMDWKVMVDSDRAIALGVDSMARDNPDLPRDTLTTMSGIALKAYAIGLEPGSRLNVYSGPGGDFLRGGGGKALVGTAEKLLLYGADHGWALIQYAVSKDKLRFGYIPLDTLPERYMDIRLLPPVNLYGQAEKAIVIRDTFVTDDPNASRDVLASLREGLNGVLLLGMLDQKWAYVQAVDEKGKMLRGFVPAVDIAGTKEAAVPSYVVPKGTVKLYAEGSKSPGRYDAGKKYDVIPVNAQTIVLSASANDIWELNRLPRLERIQAPYANASFKSIGGILFSKDGKRLLLYPAGRAEEEYAPPEGTEHIYCPLYIAPALKSLILPSTVTELPDSSDLSGLQALYAVPDNTAFLSRDGVLFSKDRTELVFYPPARQADEYAIPEGTKAFSNQDIFKEAHLLKTLVLPKSFTDFKTDTLFAALEGFLISGDHPAYSAIDGLLFSRDGSTLVFYPPARPEDTYVAPVGVKNIGEFAFPPNAANLRHVILPEGLEVIGDGAFQNCESLESVFIPDSVKTIEFAAFENCSNLTSVNIPPSLTIIEALTFAWSGLSGTLVIPEGVVSIQDEAFFSVDGLTDLYLPASLAYMDIWANLILNEKSDPSHVTIHAPAGSYAAKIAVESGFDHVIEEP